MTRRPRPSSVNDLYTETKVVAERFELAQNGVDGMLTCAIRPSGISGESDQIDVPQAVRKVCSWATSMCAGSGAKSARHPMRNNLIHGFILAASLGAGRHSARAFHQRRRADQYKIEFARPVPRRAGKDVDFTPRSG